MSMYRYSQVHGLISQLNNPDAFDDLAILYLDLFKSCIEIIECVGKTGQSSVFGKLCTKFDGTTTRLALKDVNLKKVKGIRGVRDVELNTTFIWIDDHNMISIPKMDGRNDALLKKICNLMKKEVDNFIRYANNKLKEEKKEENIAMKFFDKKKVFVIATGIDYEVDQLRQCLLSEGLDLSIEDTLKVIDLYIRSLGLDYDYTEGGTKIEEIKDTKFKSIHSWFSSTIDFTLFDNAEDSEIELYKNVLLFINSHVEFPIDESIIRNNTNLILKHVPVFLTECINTLRLKMGEGNISKYMMTASIPGTEDRCLVLSEFITTDESVKDLKGPIVEVFSTVTSKTLNENVTIISESFATEESENEQK
jgi:hypothetical protein